MSTIDLDDTEFGHLMFILANAEGKGITWSIVNPLLMKIGEQLRAQKMSYHENQPAQPASRNRRDGAKEAPP